MDTTKKKKLDNKTISEKKVLLNKVVFDYTVEIFNNETKRQETLENKSRFYLSFISIFIGSAFFNLDFFEKIMSTLNQAQVPYTTFMIIVACIIALNVSLLFALVSILVSIGLRSYKDVFPKNVTFELFSPTSKYIEEKDLATFYETVAMNYTVALEHNKNINDKKALWVNFASAFVLISMLSLSALLSIISGIVFLK